jgi:hypothetical protein
MAGHRIKIEYGHISGKSHKGKSGSYNSRLLTQKQLGSGTLYFKNAGAKNYFNVVLIIDLYIIDISFFDVSLYR